jgi:hypothetical protein
LIAMTLTQRLRYPTHGAALIAAGMGALLAVTASAAPMSPAELATVCAEADDPPHCGRLVEAVQLKRLPNLAQRDGATLRVSLYPSGDMAFTDIEGPSGARAHSLWDFISEINAVILYTSEDDKVTFTLLQRANGRKLELPAEPRLAPDRQRIATADFCAEHCVNELAVWRVTREGVSRELVWKPAAAWADATASWKDADTIRVEYTPIGTSEQKSLERRLNDPTWSRAPAR